MSPLLAHDPVTATGAEPERWMLVLHGIYGQGRNWASVARRFVRERPSWGLMLVDLRLHGASTGFEPPHTVPRCAEDVAALAETLGAPVEGVLGHSFGGKVALLYAALAPRPPAQLWLVDSQPGPRDPDGSAWHMLEVLRRFPGPFSDRAEGIAAVESAGFATGVAQWMSTNLVPDPHGDGLVWRLRADDMEALLRSFYGTDAWGVVEDPPGAMEVHVVKARDSSVLDEEDEARVEAAARATGRAHLHRVEGGHWVNADNPEALLQLLVAHVP